MHSPIIYLSDITKENTENTFLEGVCPTECILDVEELMNNISGMDYVTADVYDYSPNERYIGHYYSDIKDLLNTSPYYKCKSLGKSIIIEISKKELKKWDERVIELNEMYNNQLKDLIDSDYKSEHYKLPINNDSNAYMDFKDLVRADIGGIRFVLYVGCDLYQVQAIKDLMEYVRDRILEGKEKVAFEVAQNVVGDYHF